MGGDPEVQVTRTQEDAKRSRSNWRERSTSKTGGSGTHRWKSGTQLNLTHGIINKNENISGAYFILKRVNVYHAVKAEI